MSESDKKISNIFSKALQSKGWDIDKLSKETGIPERFINLIMEDKIEDLPAAPYTHGYVVNIAEALDLDGGKLWKKYFKKNESIKTSGEKDKLPENRFEGSGFNKKILIIILIFVLIAGYFAARAMFASDVSGELTLNNIPEDTMTVSSSAITIKGNIDPRYELTINQARTYPDKSGNFEKEVDLSPGLNTVVFDIKGMLGKEGKVVKQIFYEDSPPENDEDMQNNLQNDLLPEDFEN